MSKIRLVVVQGPNQLLYAISVLRYQEAFEAYKDCEDILILGGYRHDPKLTEICLQISQIWNFKARITWRGFEYFCSDNSIDFVAAAELLKRTINLENVDFVYTLRNWQVINEIFLYAYPTARKICFAELYWLDLNSSLWSSNFGSPPVNPSGKFIPIDEVYAVIAPVDGENVFEQYPVKVIGADFFRSVVYDSAKQIEGLEDYCGRIIEQLGNSITFVLTSYDTEAGFIKNTQEEINCYLSCVLPHTRQNEAILVKGHPRQIFNQSYLLGDKLSESGRNCFVISEFTQVPVELFAPFISIEKVVAPISSASVTLGYLGVSELVIGFGEKLIRKFISPKWQEFLLTEEYLRTLLVNYSLQERYEPIKYLELKEQLKEYSQQPIYIKLADQNNNQNSIEEFTDKTALVNQIYSLVAKFQKEILAPFVLVELRHLRKQMAEFWLSTPEILLERAYLTNVGDAYQSLLNSGIHHESLTETEQSFVAEIVARVAKGFDEPKAVQYLLVAMLYFRPHQLPLKYDLTQIPTWLLNDYLKFTLRPPLYFQEIGEADNYYQYIEQWVNYLHSNIVNNSESKLWLDIAGYFTNAANFIPLYFNRVNLKDIYTKRADIIEFLLKQIDDNVEYEFPERSPERKKIRVGILAAHFGPQTETFAALPVYQYLNRDLFEIILFTLITNNHRLERYCAGHADALVKLPAELVRQVQVIREADLDILFISTNVTAVTHPITLLALHRLARLQIVDANSPVSTGMRHIDYYISSKLSEPEDAQQHYTETLVTLNSPPQCFDFATEEQILPRITISRESLGITENTVVYVSGANYFKIIPEVEATWAKIIASVPNSVILLYPFNPNWSSSYPFIAFRKRILVTFAKYGLSEDRLIILDPVPNRADVKEILKLANIYLDSYPYSGMTSLIDPLEVGLPTVTIEAETSRSQKGSSLLRELQLPDLITSSEAAYIQLAVALGTNPKLRQRKSDRLQQRMQANPIFLDSRSFCAQIGELFQELFHKHQAIAFAEKLKLKDINLIIFPDWSQPEELLCQELEQVIGAIATHPNSENITLLVDTSHISHEEAELFLSGVTMNLLMQDLDVSEGLEISLLGDLSVIQWQVLLPCIQARIVLEQEDRQAIVLVQVEKLPAYNLDSFMASNREVATA